MAKTKRKHRVKSNNKTFFHPDIVCWFDGATAPMNPGGYMGWGAIIKDGEQERYFFDGKDKHDENSNNCAEYLGFIEILNYFLDTDTKNKQILIMGDSQLVVNQMSFRWDMKSGLYFRYAQEAKGKLLKLLEKNIVVCRWIPRLENSDADQLSNEGIKKVAGEYVAFDEKYWLKKYIEKQNK